MVSFPRSSNAKRLGVGFARLGFICSDSERAEKSPVIGRELERLPRREKSCGRGNFRHSSLSIRVDETHNGFERDACRIQPRARSHDMLPLADFPRPLQK